MRTLSHIIFILLLLSDFSDSSGKEYIFELRKYLKKEAFQKPNMFQGIDESMKKGENFFFFNNNKNKIQATFYVSPEGDDRNPGTIKKPFKTITKAQEEVRKINRNMTGDIIVYLMEGKYFIDRTIHFKNIDSGSNGFKVSYKNSDEPGSACILGAHPADNWQKHKEKIYKIKIQPDIDINFIYENDIRSELARFPNREDGMHTYLRALEEDSALMTTHLFFREGAIPKIAGPSSLLLYFFGGALDWNQSIEPITNIDYITNSIVVKHEQRPRYSFTKGTRYFIMGHAMELLDAPGELIHDKSTGYLYYYPLDEANILNKKIYIPKVEEIIVLRGDSLESGESSYVHNITFEGLTIGMSSFDIYNPADAKYLSESGSISLKNVKNIEIKNCRVVNSANHAITFTGYSFENKVEGNFIYEAGSAGIQINAGYTPAVNLRSGYNTIRNNFVTNIGYLAGSVGIFIAGSGHNIIENNTVCNSLRWGIALIGPGLSLSIMENEEIDGIKIDKQNPENNLQFNPTRHNVIRRNETFNCNTDSQDSGPVVTWGTAYSIVDNNLVYGTRGFGNQEGVYIDGGSHFSKVTNNIVYDISSAQNGNWKANASSFHIKGLKSEAYNNIFDFTTQDMVQGIGFQSMVGNNEISENMVFKRNILVSFSPKAGPLLRMHDRPGRPLENRFAVIDSNLYYTANGNYEVIAFRHGIEGRNKFDPDAWKSVQNNKFDRHSIYDKDPSFTNKANRDYKLKSDSPALRLGFKQIDVSNIGITKQYLFKEEALRYMENSRIAGPYVVREK